MRETRELGSTKLKAITWSRRNVATASAQEAIGITREEQQTREDQVLKDTGTTRSFGRIVIRACKHFRERGEGKG